MCRGPVRVGHRPSGLLGSGAASKAGHIAAVISAVTTQKASMSGPRTRPAPSSTLPSSGDTPKAGVLDSAAVVARKAGRGQFRAAISCVRSAFVLSVPSQYRSDDAYEHRPSLYHLQ